jgi:hypothetical protein
MFQLYRSTVIQWDLAYSLTSELNCWDARFRCTTEEAYNEILGLGVSAPNAGVVLQKLLKAGSLIVNRPHLFSGPIPPAFPKLTPSPQAN